MHFWKQKARELKIHTFALYLAYRDPRLPWYAKAWIAAVVAYAFSPIDLIPDFIPVLGYLDDLVLIPLGVWVAIRLIPPQVWEECKAKARELDDVSEPQYKIMGGIIISIWIIILLFIGWWLIKTYL